jgi:hypothetical protein
MEENYDKYLYEWRPWCRAHEKQCLGISDVVEVYKDPKNYEEEPE